MGIDFMSTNKATAKRNGSPRLQTPTDLGSNASRDIAGAMNVILADTFALYMKTKNFHWHVSGPHFRDYHLLLDEQADQIFAMTDVLAERVRKLGGTTLRSIGHMKLLQSLAGKLNRLNDIWQIAETIVAELRTMIDYHNARVYLLGDDHRTLEPIAFAGLRTSFQFGKDDYVEINLTDSPTATIRWRVISTAA